MHLVNMDLRTTALVFLVSCSPTVCVPGDPIMFLPPLEVRSMDSDQKQMFQFTNQQFPGTNMQLQPLSQDMMPMPQQREQIIHNSPTRTSTTTESTPIPTEKGPDITHHSHNFTVNDFMEVLNEISEHREGHESRAASREFQNPPSSYRQPGSYGGYPYPRPYGPPAPGYGPSPNYGPPPSTQYQPPAAYVPPTTVHHPVTKTIKPDLGLFKPVTTKVASKVSGLIGLVLTLLTGSAPDDLELSGFKDIVINGIVKPLLIAKGGIKSLISKLTIPVISLLLINLEVLITIWWLWEECPQPAPAEYHPPAAYPYQKPSY